jgi:hypothetical protein
MTKIFTFNYENEKACIDLDTVRMITFREDKISVMFKDTGAISDFMLSGLETKTKKECIDDLIDFWRE